MVQGLQVWANNGTLLVDTNTQVSTILGKVEAFAENTTYTYTNAKLTEGIPFYIVTPMSSVHNSGFITITFSGHTATIVTKYNPRDNVSTWTFVVYIGVY